MNFIQKLKYMLLNNKLLFSIFLILFSYYMCCEIVYSLKGDIPINCFSHYNLFLGEQESSIYNKISDIKTPADIYDHPNILLATLNDSTIKSNYELYISGIFKSLEKIIIKVEFKDEYILLNNFNCMINSMSKNKNIKYYYDPINSFLYIQNTEFLNKFVCHIYLPKNQINIYDKDASMHSPNNHKVLELYFFKTGLFEYFSNSEKNDEISKKEFFQLLEKYNY